MIAKMSTNSTQIITFCINNILSIGQPESIENKRNDDVFLKVLINENFLPLYYGFGTLLTQLTVIATAVAHANYTNLVKKQKSPKRLKEKPEAMETSNTPCVLVVD